MGEGKVGLRTSADTSSSFFQRGKPGQPLFQPIAAHLTHKRPSRAMFITERSWLIFHLLDVDMVHMHWLTLPPSARDQFNTYTHLRRFLQYIQVVNDAAEWVVKDVQEYTHMNSAPGDRGNVILVATDHPDHVANLCQTLTVFEIKLHGRCNWEFYCNRPVSQIWAPPVGLSRTSGKLWQDYSNCYMFWK